MKQTLTYLIGGLIMIGFSFCLLYITKEDLYILGSGIGLAFLSAGIINLFKAI